MNNEDDVKSQRKLTAIMFTDIVGYTQLSAENEQIALSVLTENSQIHKVLIAKHRGKLLKEIGDGTLAIFDSAVDAAQCAIDIQRHISEHSNHKLRIGLHIGDVLASTNDVVGNSVNIAARIQGATQSGTIAVSQFFYDAINSQIKFELKNIGKVILKGVAQPMSLYELQFVEQGSTATETAPPTKLSKHFSLSLSQHIKTIYASVLLLFIIGLANIYFNEADNHTTPEQINTNSPLVNEQTATSIAVLPFTDFSQNNEYQYFGDGLSEELLNLFAKIEGLDVVSRTSSFRYKQSELDIRAIGKELGVSHVLEGSIRYSNNTIRITAQLIKVGDGFHLWSETYDRNVNNIFAIQDDIAKSVVGSLSELLALKKVDIPTNFHPKNFQAYDAYLKGLNLLHLAQDKDAITAAIKRFNEAVEIDNNYAFAHAALCRARVTRYTMDNSNTDIIKATSSCLRAIELDPEQPEVYTALGIFHHSTGSYNESLTAFDSALKVDIDFVDAKIGKANTLVSLNRFDEAEMIYKSVDADAPQFWQAGNELGNMYLLQGRIKEAIPYFEKGIGYFKEKGAAFANLGYAYYYLGDIEKAQENWESSIAHEDNADVFSNLGTIYYQQRKFSLAIEMYKKAIAISPNVATFWGNLADAYYFSNDLEKANLNYVKASELAELALTNNDKDIESLTTLALYRARLGKHNQAKGLVKRAIDLAPQEINVLYYASVVYLQTKEYEQAWLYLENALDKGYPLDLVMEAPEFMEHISSTKFDKFREKMTQ